MGKQDDIQAIRWLQRGFKAGNADALGCLGDIYVEGIGVQKDVVHGVSLLTEAATRGSEISCLFLGDFYANGEHVTKSAGRATYWYRKMESYSSKMGKPERKAAANEWLRENAVED